jgi:hypothetical protein
MIFVFMYGLFVGAIMSSDYVSGVATTCLQLAHVISAVRPGYLYLGTEHCCYHTFDDVGS